MTASDNVMLAAAPLYLALGLGEIVPLFNLQGDICACSAWFKANRTCTPAKHPRSEGGKRLSSADKGQVWVWLEKQWPNRCNIALVRTRASGPVVDVDPKHGGFDTLVDPERLCGPLPRSTPRSRTGSGGEHIYLAHPADGPDIRSSIAREGRGLGAGVDLISIGNYVVAPPSETDKGPYLWLPGCGPAVPRAPIPERWRALLQPPTRTPQVAGGTDNKHGDPSLPIGQAAWEFINAGVPPGTQRWRALSATRNLLAAGKTTEETVDLIWQGLEHSSQEPGRPAWTKADAEAIVENLEASEPKPLEERTARLQIRVKPVREWAV